MLELLALWGIFARRGSSCSEQWFPTNLSWLEMGEGLKEKRPPEEKWRRQGFEEGARRVEKD